MTLLEKIVGHIQEIEDRRLMLFLELTSKGLSAEDAQLLVTLEDEIKLAQRLEKNHEQ